MTSTTVKQVAQELLDELPEEASWEDLIYRFRVRQAIEEGTRDSDAGRVMDTAELRRRLGLPPCE